MPLEVVPLSPARNRALIRIDSQPLVQRGDPSSEDETDAFAELLDSLHIEKLPVAGGSAGALSAVPYGSRTDVSADPDRSCCKRHGPRPREDERSAGVLGAAAD